MDEKWMRRALELARRGMGHVNPNPLVGAVIVREDRVIGEGWHHQYGGPHAEVNASSDAVEDVAGATLYVTLEPCSHYGKTPPCAELVAQKRIGRVVVAMTDPNPLVSGKGLELLRTAGIEVLTGVLEEEAKRLNEVFIKYISTGKPFCLWKSAMTLDGKTATHTGHSRWITGEESRRYVHELRHRLSAIMVGVGTILADNPQLTTRLENGSGKDAARIVVDSAARIPLDAKVLHLDSPAPTILAVTERAAPEKRKALEDLGAEVIITPTRDGKVDLPYLMEELGKRQLDSVLLEGGGELAYSALRAGIIDKANLFIAPKLIGGWEAKTPVEGEGIGNMDEAIPLESMTVHRFGGDIMLEGYLAEGGTLCSQV